MSAAEALSALAGTPSAHGREDGERTSRVVEGEFVSPKSAAVGVSDGSQGRKRSVDEGDGRGGKEEAKPTPRKRKASAVTDDGQSVVNGKPKKRTVKEKPNNQTSSGKPAAPPPAKTLEPARTAYNPKRISEPRSILQPISRDELAYIRNPRNIRNPLKTGRPRIVVQEDEPYPPPETRSMEPVTEEPPPPPPPPVIERGGDKRGVQVRRLGGRDAEDARNGGEGKRGREEVEEREGKRPRVEAHEKGYQVADHCMSFAPFIESS